MEQVVVKAENITKSYQEGELKTEVLKGINLEVNEGEFVAIVGESGSGKSTLLYILAGIDKPTSGKVTLLGQDVATLNDQKIAQMRRRDFSFVYQFDNLVENLTAYENIMLPLLLDKVKEKDAEVRVKKVAEDLGLSHRLKNFPKEMSGGEQQRVAIARALVTNPKVIFLDEPTGSLDKARGEQVMELLKDINEKHKVALIMVTHSIAHSKYAQRIINVEDGLIKQLDSID